MSDTRRGLNCTLSYPDGKAVRAYRVRCTNLLHGYEMIAEESEARRGRAFYPRMTAPTQFALRVALIGRRERDSFNSYLMRYVEYILDPGITGTSTPQITVTVPSRRFTRIGVPLSGLEFGDHLGSMVFAPWLTFETSGEPLDWDQKYRLSSVYADRAVTRSPASEYFYPTGTQLAGGASPVDPEGLSTMIQAVVNGAASIDQSVQDVLEAID